MHHLALIGIAIATPDETSRAHGAQRQGLLTKPTGALGRLEELSLWACAVQGTCPPAAFTRARVVIFAGDHGIARTAMTSAYPPEVTAQMVLNFVRGGAAANVLAELTGASVRVVDISVDADPSYAVDAPDAVAHRVVRSSGSIDREPAISLDQAVAAFAVGRQVADQEIDSGADLLIAGDMGIGNTTPASTLIGVLCAVDAQTVTGRGTGIDQETWERKRNAVGAAMVRGQEFRDDPLALLACVGGADFAAMSGFLIQASVRGVPVILDGTVSCACALVVNAITDEAKAWWRAGHLSTEQAQHLALSHLGLEPIVDLGLRLGEGTGALVALPILQAAIATLANMATFEQAGVSDKDAS